MKTILSFLLVFLSTAILAQTKVIAHKSHSGNKNTFSKAYKNKLFDDQYSNFGLPGNRNIIVLDTVLAVNDSLTILKYRISSICYPHYKTPNYKKLDDSDFEAKTDTLINNPIWNKSNTEAFIRNARENKQELRIWFENPLYEVVLIGFKEEY